ncbi:MAG: efflux RND transporter periplasmic adaptor subunit [Firmicutes bacterium]|nr:efflux RND transporter periplasmic adaptor subunit [Bacillota bacterium]
MNRLLVFPVLCLLGLACGQRRQEAVGPVAAIAIASPRKVQEAERVVVSGTTSSPGASSLVAFLVPGRVMQVFPREGAPVKQGQVLATMDAANLSSALEAAKAQAKAAEAGALRAEEEFQRMKRLFDTQSLAPNDFAKFKAAAEAAKQQWQQALAGQAIAQKNLDDSHLRAPIGGYIARRSVEPGVMVAAGQPVFEIANLDPVEINVGVPETDIRLVKVGQPAQVAVPALPGRTFQGVVQVVNISADPATRTYLTRIRVPNHERELKVGMVAEVSITGNRKLDMIVVPAEAIVRDPQGATLVFQYFADQKRVFSKRVEVGALLGHDIQIRSGLSGDEAIVVAGQHGLRNGMVADVSQERK